MRRFQAPSQILLTVGIESYRVTVRQISYTKGFPSKVTVLRFQGGMIDSLNAEISLGTVANTRDGVRWLGYTYLFVRMRKNPFVYGPSISDYHVHGPTCAHRDRARCDR